MRDCATSCSLDLNIDCGGIVPVSCLPDSDVKFTETRHVSAATKRVRRIQLTPADAPDLLVIKEFQQGQRFQGGRLSKSARRSQIRILHAGYSRLTLVGLVPVVDHRSQRRK